MPQRSPSRDADKIVIRVPDGMRATLVDRARRNMRSTNAEVVLILRDALGDEGLTATGPSPGKANPAAATHEAALQGGPEIHR